MVTFYNNIYRCNDDDDKYSYIFQVKCYYAVLINLEAFINHLIHAFTIQVCVFIMHNLEIQ